MIMIGWMMLTGAILFNTLGNVFIKQFSAGHHSPGLFDYLALPFLIGLACFAINVVLYSRALQDISIVVAYPILVGASIGCISLIAVSWFGERFGITHGVGIGLVVLGIAVLARAA